MRGFPLLNVLLLVLGLAAAAIPLIALSSKSGPDNIRLGAGAETADKKSQWKVDMSIRLARAASSVEIVRDGVILHAWNEEAMEFSETLTLPVYDGQMEFEVRVAWPEDATESVAEVTVQPEGEDHTAQTRNIWGSGKVAEVIQFFWSE